MSVVLCKKMFLREFFLLTSFFFSNFAPNFSRYVTVPLREHNKKTVFYYTRKWTG